MTDYRLRLPWPAPPHALRGNSRAHWAQRAKQAAEVRSTVAWLAKAARIPKCEHLTVGLVWAPGDRRVRDADNLVAFLKVACDALARGRRDWVGLTLVPDDRPAHMTKVMPVILPPEEAAETGMWLLVTTRGEAA